MRPPRIRRMRGRYTEAEVRAMMEQAVRDTGEKFTEILAKAAKRALTEPQREALAEAWDWECFQSGARIRAGNGTEKGIEA